MSAKDDTVFLHHILDAIARIDLYLTNVDRMQFDNNLLLQDGVIRREQIIGEAVHRLSAELKVQYPDVPWRRIANMRHRLVHDYLGVDLDIVWSTAIRSIPPLKSQVQRILDDLSSTSQEG